MTSINIDIGDVVFVCYHGKPLAKCKVTRIMKRLVELDDGSKWTPGGSGRYPYRPWDFFDLRHYTPELDAACSRYIALQKVKNANFNKLNDASLYQIVEMIEKND